MNEVFSGIVCEAVVELKFVYYDTELAMRAVHDDERRGSIR